MLISFTVVVVVAILVALLITFLFYKLFVKLKKKAAGGITTGLVVGGLAVAAIVMGNARVYVVKGAGSYSTYAAYGTPEYKMGNGETVKIDLQIGHSIVINDSEEVMVLEKIYYGSMANPEQDELLGAYGHLEAKDIIDHFFDNRPPATIKKETAGSFVRVYWVRTLSSYVEEYGDLFTDEEYEEEEEYEEDEDEAADEYEDEEEVEE